MVYLTDIEIIESLKSGKRDNVLINQFVRQYQSFVYSTAFRFLQSHDDAEDIAQEVFIKALNKIDKFRADSSIKTWLYRITINLCINAKRKKRFLSIFSSSKDNEDDEGFDKFIKNEQTPERLFENKEFEETFVKLLDKLPLKQRETFALRYFDELSYEEISKLLGTSVGGLKANYFQAVKKLASIILDKNEG